MFFKKIGAFFILVKKCQWFQNMDKVFNFFLYVNSNKMDRTRVHCKKTQLKPSRHLEKVEEIYATWHFFLSILYWKV
jgi:CRISPR/Cas system CSM-associated protein Csm5 (group 7 of RAMP superfamily)